MPRSAPLNAVITSSDCRSTDWQTFREYGTHLSASLLVLLHAKETFPEWDAIFVNTRKQWRDGKCKSVFEEFQQVYSKKSGGQNLRLLNVATSDYEILSLLEKYSGKETDHSRGHWPVDAYAHLVVAEPLLRMGYDYTVYVDPDHFFLDSSLLAEIPKVVGIACISAIPTICLTNSISGNRALKEIHDEYRLVSQHELLTQVRAAAAKFGGSGYTVPTSTNSGLVIYDNLTLTKANWTDWLVALFAITSKGFYGDQTALTVAMGRDDIPIHWLPSRFNVPLTLPRSYVQSTCGADAVYSRHSARPENSTLPVSSVHFVWGPKPWMSAITKPHKLHLAAVQADLLYVNAYRDFVRRTLSSDLARRLFHPLGLSFVNETQGEVMQAPYHHCQKYPEPCVAQVR